MVKIRRPFSRKDDQLSAPVHRHPSSAKRRLGGATPPAHLPGHPYQMLEPVDTAVIARTDLFSDEFDRLFDQRN